MRDAPESPLVLTGRATLGLDPATGEHLLTRSLLIRKMTSGDYVDTYSGNGDHVMTTFTLRIRQDNDLGNACRIFEKLNLGKLKAGAGRPYWKTGDKIVDVEISWKRSRKNIHELQATFRSLEEKRQNDQPDCWNRAAKETLKTKWKMEGGYPRKSEICRKCTTRSNLAINEPLR